MKIKLPNGDTKPVMNRKERKFVDAVKRKITDGDLASHDVFKEAEREVYGDKSASNGKYRERINRPAVQEALKKELGLDGDDARKELADILWKAARCQHEEFTDPKQKIKAWDTSMKILASALVETKSQVRVTDESIKNMSNEELLAYIKKGEEEPEAKTETIQ